MKKKLVAFCLALLCCSWLGVSQPTISRVIAAEKNTAQVGITGGDLEKLSPEQIANLNPLVIAGGGGQVGDGTNLGTNINVILNIVYGLATIILTVMLVWGGIEIMMAGTTGKSGSADAGKKRVMAAIVGFLITFGSFLIMQLIQNFLGIKISGF